jgi:tetratricopeptide (TPR) repeat protein
LPRCERRWLLAALVAVAVSSGCSATPPSAPRGDRGDLATSLVELGEAALARDELPAAQDRFERALRAQPDSVPARVGLGRVADRLGNELEAEERFREALELDPDSVEARLALGRLLRRSGRVSLARQELARAIELDPWRSAAHAELATLTGPAPRTPVPNADAALAVARAHPYDGWAALRAGDALADAGRVPEAVEQLSGAIWLADLDPPAASAALNRLASLDPAWRERRVVAVHSWADDGIRARPGWRFRLRLTWLALSQSVRETLGIEFVLVSIGAFSSKGTSAQLEPIFEAFRRQTTRAPAPGILAAFTDRPRPRRPGRHRRGLAEFLGRSLIVRLAPEGELSRVLAHEVLHLFGGVHVTEDVTSLMNPTGGSFVLDPPNARIVRELRERRFARGGIDANVLPWIDLESTTAAFESALTVNLAFRRAGITQALDAAQHSRYDARRIAREAVQLDSHLADVTQFLATLLLQRDRPAEAIALLEAAVRLYGPNSAKGKRAQSRADALRRFHGARPDERG